MAGAVDGAVDDPGVDLPEQAGELDAALDHRGVVELVHPVLVEQQLVGEGEALGEPARPLVRLRTGVEAGGEPDPEARHRERQHDQPELEAERHVGRGVLGAVLRAVGRLADRQDHRLEELLDPVELGTAEELAREAEEAANDRQHAEHLERHGHRPRRLVEVVLGLVAAPELAVEGHVDQAEHVERGQHGAGDGQHPEQRVHGAEAVEVGVAGSEGLGQDLVLGEEAGEREDAGDREGGDQEGPVGGRHVLSQPAHLPHVLLAAAGVDHRARAEEEAGLEEGVGHEVEDRRDEGADAGAEEHVAELATRSSRRGPS